MTVDLFSKITDCERVNIAVLQVDFNFYIMTVHSWKCTSTRSTTL